MESEGSRIYYWNLFYCTSDRVIKPLHSIDPTANHDPLMCYTKRECLLMDLYFIGIKFENKFIIGNTQESFEHNRDLLNEIKEYVKQKLKENSR